MPNRPSSSMIAGVLLSALLAVAAGSTAATVCPAGCDCSQGYVVTCVGLSRLPDRDLPPATTILDISDSRIERLDAHAFSMCPLLHTLILNSVALGRLHPDAFRQLSRLKQLYLEHNALEHLPPHVFSSQTQLSVLSLSHNRLRHVDRRSVFGLRRLRVLHLQHNNISSLSGGVLQQALPRLKHLTLQANPLNCTCQLASLVTLLKQINADSGAKCASPAEYSGRRLAQLDVHRLRCRPPQFVQQPESATFTVGQTMRLKCAAEGQPTPVVYWLKNGKTLDLDAHSEYRLEPDGSLLIGSANASHQGAYECVAENEAGRSRTRRALVQASGDRHTRPYFTVAPRDIGVREGDRTQLFCRAEGIPKPEIFWTRRGRRMTWSPRIQLEQENTVLMFMQVLHTDEGHEVDYVINQGHGHHRYTCVALNSVGANEVTVNLKVLSSMPPRIVEAPSDQVARIGHTVTFRCTASGDPEPYIGWLFNGSPIPNIRGHYQISSDTFELRIINVTLEDKGHYWCQANNAVGSMSTDMHLDVLDQYGQLVTAAPAFQPRQTERPLPATRAPDIIVDEEVEQRARNIPRQRLNNNNNNVSLPVSPNANYKYEAPPPAKKKFVKVAERPRERIFIDDDDEIGSIIRSSVAEARRNVDRAINATRSHLYSNHSKSPHELLELFRFPGPQAIELARAREIYEEAISIIERELRKGVHVAVELDNDQVHYESLLSVSHLQLLMELTGCVPGQIQIDPCSQICMHAKYRSYDGQCNNFDQPMWGAALMPFTRLLQPMYENGFTTPVGWEHGRLYHGYPKPNAREVSMKVMSTADITPDPKYSSMLMQWGQFLDHDIDFTAGATSRHVYRTGAICNRTCERYTPCFNIDMPDDDERRQDDMYTPCIEFERSSAVCGSGSTSVIFKRVTQREQINMITSFMDASNVYGSSEQDALDLRDLFSDHGLLRFDIVSQTHKPYLPFNRDAPMDCRRKVNVTHPIRCFLAGDFRANEQLGLTAMHTIWLREHNRLASQLLLLNQHWDGEKIYQETRKIIGAVHQHITYTQWLPKILGPKGMMYIPKYMGYNSSVNPSISNSFATAAFRFGHAMINPMISRLDDMFKETREGHLPLHEAFFSPERLLSEGGIDPLIRGLFVTPMKQPRPDQQLNKELTERLFSKAHHVALDLAALNIQRGRDHALPGYTAFRRWCGFGEAQGWEDLYDHIGNMDVIAQLKQLYGHPANVDLWVGGMVETSLPDARVGPTFACIIADQFRRLRDGDRFWYEQPGVFSQLQLNEIKKVTLAKVLCENADTMDRITPDVFLSPTDLQQQLVDCPALPALNLNMWQQCCEQSCMSSMMTHHESHANEADDFYGDSDVGSPNSDATYSMLMELKDEVKQLKSKLDMLQGCQVDGQLKQEGDEWMIDTCTKCTCKMHTVWCEAMTDCR